MSARLVAAYLAGDLGIGTWPREGLVVLPSRLRERPGWGGWVTPLFGVLRRGAGVLSVSPHWFDVVASWAATCPSAEDAFGPDAVQRLRARLRPASPGRIELGVVRYCTRVRRLRMPYRTVALRPDDPRLPAWARGRYDWRCVAVLDGGEAVSVATVKQKSPLAWEIAVGTSARSRGRGMATAVVAAAARAILGTGRVPVYVHDLDNAASARVAEAAGFRVFGRQVWAVK